MAGFEILGNSAQELKEREQQRNRAFFESVGNIYTDRKAAIRVAYDNADSQLLGLVYEFFESAGIEDEAQQAAVRLTAEQLLRIMPQILNRRERLETKKSDWRGQRSIDYKPSLSDTELGPGPFINAMCISARATSQIYRGRIHGDFVFYAHPTTEPDEIQGAYHAARQAESERIRAHEARYGIDSHLE